MAEEANEPDGMLTTLGELDEILSKDCFEIIADRFRKDQMVADERLIGFGECEQEEEAQFELVQAFKRMSKLNMEIEMIRYAIKRKFVDTTTMILKEQFADEFAKAAKNKELLTKVETSAMLLISRTFLRAKVTTLQHILNPWRELHLLIKHYSEDGGDLIGPLIKHIYRWRFGSANSIRKELMEEEELLLELEDSLDKREVLADCDRMIDKAFPYQVDCSNSAAIDGARRLKAICSKSSLESWLCELIDQSLLEKVNQIGAESKDYIVKFTEGELSSVSYEEIEEDRRAFLRSAGMQCDDDDIAVQSGEDD